METPKVGEVYRHYKGGVYVVTGFATHSETLEELVIYRDASFRSWARPLEMFVGLKDGVKRFEKLEGRSNERKS
jgi:hypothetical protein